MASSPSPEDHEEDEPRVQKTQAELDAFFAKIDLLRAENEAKGIALIRTWMTPETRERYDALQKRSKEEIDAEDARLFRPQPQYLGVGAEIPADFLASESQTGNKALRAKLLPATTLKASKKREEAEKEASKKRGLRQESSDEEEGRSALGRKKKRKLELVVGRSQSAVNPLISNGTLNLDDEEETKVRLGLTFLNSNQISLSSPSPQDHSTDPVDEMGNFEGKKKRKRRKKSKGMLSEGVEDEIVSSTEAKLCRTIDVRKTSLLDEELQGSAKSKEQKKKEKKARKDERRRLKMHAA